MGLAIGIMHMMVAKASGASTVIVSEPNDMRRNTVADFGADVTVDPLHESLKDVVLSHTDGLGADVVILAIGNPRIVNDAFAIAKKGGRISMFAGFTAGEMPPWMSILSTTIVVVVGQGLTTKSMKTAVIYSQWCIGCSKWLPIPFARSDY
jgi:L-iditol 2-dehydrogenase